MAPEICSNCGARVPRNAKACPECGSDEQTGWSDEARVADLDLPDEEFDYGEFVEREFGEKRPGPKRLVPRGVHWLWWVVGIVILIALVLLWLH